MSADKCRRLIRRVETNVDKCRRIKQFYFDSRKELRMVPFSCCRNYATVGHIGMQIFNFIVLSVTIAHHSVFFPHISKTHLSISSFNIRELE